ncbi:MAG TPA: pilus assembly protein TadG-related protein [Pyrinomonadaceae bacterium]|nr:pilus assembly protein TadG-related protein [Pyrinomonadaceae bacterium]
MLLHKEQRSDGQSNERGSISIMTAIFALLLLLMVGLTIDISRIYVVRSELQNAADMAALTAARELNGGPGGIDNAYEQAVNVIANSQGLKTKTNVTIDSVQFAANLYDDPYMSVGDARNNAAGIRFVKVITASTSTTILFASSAMGASHTESREAVAGMSVPLAGLCDFFPAAVGLNTGTPTPGTLMTLKFAQGTGTTATINEFDYIVLDVNCIPGNGDTETAKLAAGEPCECAKLGDFLHMTPSSNFSNGGSAAGDGMNTRFGLYANGYGNSLNASNYASDTNTTDDISYSDYISDIPTGGNSRRVITMPIVTPKDYPADTNGEIIGWGKFFIKKRMYVVNGNCANNAPCGDMTVEYIGQATVGATGAVSCNSGIRTAVLYR